MSKVSTEGGLAAMFVLVVFATIIAVKCIGSSEGDKFGTLQKVSHKTFPCESYVIEVSYEGGRAVSSGESSSYQNSQEFSITAQAYDTLTQHLGDKIIFSYKDQGPVLCGPRRTVTSIKFKL